MVLTPQTKRTVDLIAQNATNLLGTVHFLGGPVCHSKLAGQWTATLSQTQLVASITKRHLRSAPVNCGFI